MRSFYALRLAVVGLAAGLSSTSFGADPEPTTKPAEHQGTTSTQMTPDLKKDMADMYQKMADCLRTDKTMEQCSQDAMKNCPVVQKTGHCPINEGMGPMKGKKMKKMGMGMGMMKDMPPASGGDAPKADEPKPQH